MSVLKMQSTTPNFYLKTRLLIWTPEALRAFIPTFLNKTSLRTVTLALHTEYDIFLKNAPQKAKIKTKQKNRVKETQNTILVQNK